MTVQGALIFLTLRGPEQLHIGHAGLIGIIIGQLEHLSVNGMGWRLIIKFVPCRMG